MWVDINELLRRRHTEPMSILPTYHLNISAKDFFLKTHSFFLLGLLFILT